MSATRDVTISVQGVPFVVTIWLASPGRPKQDPRRMCVRLHGSKHEIDALLACDVLSEIDKRIKSDWPIEDILGIPFYVPTPAGGAG